MDNGPTYFENILADPKYPGPYKDPKGNLTSVTTPDPYTIQFHLLAPFPDFDYVVGAFSQTAPVEKAKDTGANYQLHPMSTGPYMFQSYQPNKQLVLVPNPNWTQNEDPAGQAAGQQDRRRPEHERAGPRQPADGRGHRHRRAGHRRAGGGAGQDPVQPVAEDRRRRRAGQPRVVHLPQHQGRAAEQPGLPPGGRVRGEQDRPADRVGRPVRRRPDRDDAAAARHERVQLVRPVQREDGTRPATSPTAKAALTKCGQPNGFTVGATYRSDRRPRSAAIQALQASLARVGIKLQLHGYPSGSYYSTFAGAPNYVHQHNLGILLGGWSPDWPDGYGMMDELVAGNTIVATGNTNIGELKDPKVDSMFQQTTKPGLTTAQVGAIYGQIDKQAMSDAVDPAERVRHQPDLPEPGGHQRVRVRAVRGVQLRRHRCQLTCSGPATRVKEGAAPGIRGYHAGGRALPNAHHDLVHHPPPDLDGLPARRGQHHHVRDLLPDPAARRAERRRARGAVRRPQPDPRGDRADGGEARPERAAAGAVLAVPVWHRGRRALQRGPEPDVLRRRRASATPSAPSSRSGRRWCPRCR